MQYLPALSLLSGSGMELLPKPLSAGVDETYRAMIVTGPP
jgi:hypothetical protein